MVRMFQMPRKAAARAVLSAFVAALLASAPLSGASADDDAWPMLRKAVFGDWQIEDGKDLLFLDAPDQAEDAAIVPITVRIPPEFKEPFKALTLIIDKNPSPVAATFTFGPAAGREGGERRMSTRVRIDMFSHVRAILETEDGKLHMVTRFIKAAGGCSAPVPKESGGTDPDLGKIVIKSFDPAVDAAPLREAQIMIRHPNTNGMQRDPVTQGYFPARFVKEMLVTRGDDLVFRMESGISISSDPNFRFTYANGPENSLDVKVTDTDETVFTAKAGARGS
jgi:sulfur-oxidizing protein SoxY